MDRRDFIRLAGAGVAAGTTQASMAARQSAPAQSARPAPRTTARMKVGTQHDSSDEVLGVLAALGVRHICSRLPSVRLDDQWSAEGLQQASGAGRSVRHHARHGPAADELQSIDRAEYPSILLGKSPERDREIDHICQMIRNAAKAGIPSAQVQPDAARRGAHRHHAGPRRRQVQHVRLRQGQAGSAADGGRAGRRRRLLGAHHLLSRARDAGGDEYKVRMACHPQDPGMPQGKGYRGVETVLGSSRA